MLAAQLDAYARGSWRGFPRVLSFAAFAAYTIATAHAQTTAAPAATGQTPNAQPSTGNAQAPATQPGADLGGPGLELKGRRLNAGGSLVESYTTNALGVPNSGSSGEFITSLGLYLDAHDHTARFDGDLNYSLIADIYMSHSQYNRISNYFNGLANAVLIQNRLFLRATAYAQPILLNGFGALNAAGTNSGLRSTYGYTVSPELTFRLGDFARSDTVLTQSALFIDNPGGVTINQTVPGVVIPANSLVSYGGSESISSGRDFYRLNWTINGSAFKTTQGSLDFEQELASASLGYAVSHAVVLTGQFGYAWFSSSQTLSQSISGVFALGGFQYTPSPSARLSARAGTQFGSTSYVGDLFWQFGPSTSVDGAVTDTAATAGSLLIGNLTNLGVNGSGAFYNTSYQVNPATPPTTVSNVTGFNPLPLGLTSLTGSVAHYRTGNLSLIHMDGRTQYRLTGYYSTYETLTPLPTGVPPSGNATGVTFDVFRAFTPQLSGSAAVYYSAVKDLGNRYNLLQGSVGLNYLMSLTLQAFFNATYIRRDTSDDLAAISPVSASVSAATFSIGIRKQFF
jgi:uncharacterized protein (PEP-CTERM system associated)